MKGSVYNNQMCRSIKKLRDPKHFPVEEEIRAAALQYIRKVSNFRQPSRINQLAFEQAVTEVAASTRTLLEKIQPNAVGK
jgi:hypothetical protein